MRLFYQDAYLTTFEAQVVARMEVDRHPALALDRTAFFPTSGGQPSDLGQIDGLAVLAIQEQDGLIWHQLPGPLTAERVTGVVDWLRRWDHMQSHSGQHILSQALVVIAQADTVGWHLSASSLTIDLDRVDLNEEDLEQAEELANQIIQENRSISARLIAPEDVPGLGLRKQPPVNGSLRVVEISDFDRIACSGTHVKSTAEVGLIKILRAERRGDQTRIYFACGGRALADYRRKHQLVRILAGRFSCGEDELPQAVERLQGEAQASYRGLRSALEALVAVEAERLWSEVAMQAPPRTIVGAYPDWEPEQVKRLALALRGRPGCLSILAGEDPPLIHLVRSDDLDIHAGQVLRQALTAVGGKGGGSAEVAQGKAPSPEAARQAMAIAAELAQAGQG